MATPAIHTTTHRIRFSDLDPYRHMRTAMYPAYFVDHRMEALREQGGVGPAHAGATADV